jgi:hypothetical protein
MTENKIELKPISELLKMKFFIPSYQRGYRWTTQQVKDLLEDIFNFTPKDDEWYCLQPLVVKQKGDDVWEVIDGQQRLTTIFLIIHYFNEMWVGKQKIDEPTINYQTRVGSYEFLKGISVGDDGIVKSNDTNIDFWHISTAYETIHDWVKEKGYFDNNNFQSKFKEKTKVIWYETSESDAVRIFTRINMGKIPLTNAELIKALFLNSSNFKTVNENSDERIRLKQLEIASEWDSIEYSLHDDEFWWFINKDKNEKDTRIEFLFELIVGDHATDEFYTFRKYYKKFKTKKEKEIENNWKEIKRHFQTLQDWYNSRDLYHKIGFLVTTGERIKTLIEESHHNEKSKFVKLIDQKIANQLKGIQLSKIVYISGSTTIKHLLLLHNIQTMLNNSKENSRFPFNRYKKETWDIEHIHAIATEMPKNTEQKEDWLKYAKELLESIKPESEEKKELTNRCSAYDENEFENIYQEVSAFVGESDVDNLSNLVLLDASTNRGYKNEFFSFKRKTIIEKEKEGTFVPICTKNVFMKYYSDKIDQMTFWGEGDRNSYIANIKEVLKKYLPNQEA